MTTPETTGGEGATYVAVQAPPHVCLDVLYSRERIHGIQWNLGAEGKPPLKLQRFQVGRETSSFGWLHRRMSKGLE